MAEYHRTTWPTLRRNTHVYLIFISPYFTPKFVSSCVMLCQGVSHRLISRLHCSFIVMLILEFQQILQMLVIDVVIYRITRQVDEKERNDECRS